MATQPQSDTDREAEINGITVNYTDTGEGTLPLIFVHGFPFDRSLWQPQIEAFKKDHRVIAYDIRGFGRSAAGSDPASIDLFAGELLGLMDHLKIKKAIVCGHSMGGYIVMNALGRSPEKFHAVVLSHTQCIADSEEAREKRSASIRQIEKEGLGAFSESFLKAAFSEGTSKSKPQLVDAVKKIVLSTPVRTVTSTLQALAQRRESCSLLKQVKVPALILYGKKDEVIPASQAELLFNTFEHAQLHAIEHAGHLASVEQPDQFNKLLSAFIDSL